VRRVLQIRTLQNESEMTIIMLFLYCSRDRNKEHARFTRLRKKAYVNKLEALLQEMTAVAEAEELERRNLGEKIRVAVSCCVLWSALCPLFEPR